MDINQEIKQKKFDNKKQKAIVNLMYTYGYITHIQAKAIKPFGISLQQFNLLRILKGQSPSPASVKLLTERMIDKMSNASRLVDKLLAKGYVDRESCKHDRRQVDIVITEKGIELVDQASIALNQILEDIELSEEEASALSDTLDKIRG